MLKKKTEYQKLKQFFKEIAKMTLDHDVIEDRACVTADRLSKSLMKVSKEWYLIINKKGRK